MLRSTTQTAVLRQLSSVLGLHAWPQLPLTFVLSPPEVSTSTPQQCSPPQHPSACALSPLQGSASMRQQSTWPQLPSAFVLGPLQVSASMCRQFAGTSFNRTSPEAPKIKQSKGQQKLCSALEGHLLHQLSTDTVVKEALVQRYGFAIHHVHLSRDRKRCSILWGCYPNLEKECEAALNSTFTGRFKNNLGKGLKTKFIPSLEFYHDALNEKQEKVVAVMEQVEAEVAAVAKRAGGGKPSKNSADALTLAAISG